LCGAHSRHAARQQLKDRTMRIAMVGSGYVGLVSGACLAQFGHDVICIDKVADKVAQLCKGDIPIYEPGLENLVIDNVRAGRLTFDTSVAKAVSNADAVFIAVGTPTRRGNGHADLSYVYSAAVEIAKALRGYTVVVIKSTVPVGSGREVSRIIREARPDAEFDVAANPEFLREGAAIADFMKPDRVIIGVETIRARDVMAAIYRPLNLIQTPIVFTNIETAEVTKYAGNAFLATKITFINEIADLCEKVGADVHDVARGIGLDGRIGRKFLHPGPGFGGSCFPKDTLALTYTARQVNAPQTIVEQVIVVNDARKKRMAEKVVEFCGGSVAGLTVGVLGLTFKPDTDDMRDAPSLDILSALEAAGARIVAFDPEGMKEAASLMPSITFVGSAYDAAASADVLVVITEWAEFRGLDPRRLKELMRQPRIVDLRNIFDPEELRGLGFAYEGVGRRRVPAPALPTKVPGDRSQSRFADPELSVVEPVPEAV
jgi:UDPglucose 6-dehydrogenase